jgi:hypothetical protein
MRRSVCRFYSVIRAVLVRDQLLQPRILPLELLEPARLIDAESAILPPPPVVRLLGDPELPTYLTSGRHALVAVRIPARLRIRRSAVACAVT